MSLPRRLAVLHAAEAAGAVVVEDDYDSEFQYESRPIAALQGIDRAGCVAYLGTFSKVLAPGLRVAYAILPSGLLGKAVAVLDRLGAAVPVHVQAALCDMLREGHLRAHVRRMTARYAQGMALTRDALRRRCGHALEVGDGAGGLQLAAWLRDARADDRRLAARLRPLGFAPSPLSDFHIGVPRPGLLFGIAQATPDRAEALAHHLAAALAAAPERPDVAARSA